MNKPTIGGLVAICLAVPGVAVLAAPPVIDASSVTLSQVGNRTAVVRYRLTGAPAVVTFDIEHRDGDGNWSSIDVDFVTLSGDVNRLVQPDDSALKEIRWEARNDWPDQSFQDGSIRARVTAWDKAAPPDYMVIDLSDFSETFYETADRLPLGGLSNDYYRTNALVMRRIHAAGQTFVMGQQTRDSDSSTCEASFRYRAPEHWVSLTNDFYMAVFETTQRQHQRLQLVDGGGNKDSRDLTSVMQPVDAMSYNKLRGSVEEGIDWPVTGTAVGGLLAAFRANSGIEFDIPTEAEWEFACRAGTQSAFYDGSEFTTADEGSATLGDLAWFCGNCVADSELTNDNGYYGGIKVPGLKRPNAWGLYDMYGNASEWCKDWAGAYDTASAPTIAPGGAASNAENTVGRRIKRGGNWRGRGAFASSSGRRSNEVTYTVDAGNAPSQGSATWANGYRLVCPAVAK